MNKPEIDFVEFPKMARLNREIIVTEKIDGTNAQIFVDDSVQGIHYPASPELFKLHAGSRTKWITPEDDNFGFAGWVERNKDELMQLGPGHHFGEWWGPGIQRGYGLKQKQFSLFNVSRWGDGGKDKRPTCCGVVPVLWQGLMEDFLADTVEIGTSPAGDPYYISPMAKLLEDLHANGSRAAPGFMKPEGIVIFHTASGLCFKKTLEKDESPKSLVR
jgi:hypothetical protein